MFAEWQDNPIAEMFIKRNKNTIFLDSFFKYVAVICTFLSDIGCTYHIVSFIAKGFGNFKTQHLVAI